MPEFFISSFLYQDCYRSQYEGRQAVVLLRNIPDKLPTGLTWPHPVDFCVIEYVL